VDPVGSGYGPVAGSCKYSDEPLGSGIMELVSQMLIHDVRKYHVQAIIRMVLSGSVYERKHWK
jgi:hypothetical protein